MPLTSIIRIHFMQQWFGYSDPAMEEALYEIPMLHAFAGLDAFKNKNKQRDPQMSQTKKGNQWYFGMNAHMGADVQSGLVHTVTGTTAKASDHSQLAACLHGEEQFALADRGYHKNSRTWKELEVEEGVAIHA